ILVVQGREHALFRQQHVIVDGFFQALGMHELLQALSRAMRPQGQHANGIGLAYRVCLAIVRRDGAYSAFAVLVYVLDQSHHGSSDRDENACRFNWLASARRLSTVCFSLASSRKYRASAWPASRWNSGYRGSLGRIHAVCMEARTAL